MNSKILLLSISLIGMMFISVPAKAETGSVTVNADVKYTPYSFGAAATPATPDWTKIHVLSASFTQISNFTINFKPGGSSTVTYLNSSNETAFTCVSGCDGSGFAAYSSFLNKATWNFAPNTHITASTMVLSYTQNIFTGIGSGASTFREASTNLDINEPLGVSWGDVNKDQNLAGTGIGGWSYDVVFTTTAIDSYVVSYPMPGFFNITVTKGQTDSLTKDYLHSQTTTYTQDTSFNDSTFSYFGQQLDGIYLNVTVDTNPVSFNDALINSSGVTGLPTPSPTPPPIPNGQSAAIAFDSNTYNIGATGTITTNQSFGILDFNSYRVDFFSSSNPLINQFPMDKSQTTQSFGVQFPTADTYTANIVKTVPLVGDSIIATATANAVKGTGSLSVPITVAVGKNFSVNYTLNYPAQANNMCGLGGTGIFAIFQADGSIQAQLYLLNASQLTQGTTLKVNMSVPKAGTYILQLRDCSNGVVATSIPFNAVQSSVPPEFNISFSYINLTTETIYSGDVITGIWGVDNTNYSNFPIYYELQNYSTGTILRIPLTGQKGTISQITTGYDLIHLMSVTGLIPAGLNKVSLRADTGNGGTELAFENFTFSRLTASGYDVSVDVSCVKPGEVINIHTTVPSGPQSAINIRAASDVGGNGTTIFISNSTTIQAVTNSVDEYIVSILDANNNLQKTVFFTSTYLCSGGLPSSTSGTPTPTTTQSPLQAATDVIGVLGNVAFYGFVLWLGILGVTIRTMTSNGGSVSGTGLVFVMWMASVFISIIGLFGEFKIYVLIISTIIAAITFMVGRKLTTEGEQ